MDRIALHSWTLGKPSFPDLIETARRAGYQAIEANWQDFERGEEAGLGERELRARLSDSGIEVAVVGVQPGWLFAEGPEAEAFWQRFRRTAQDAASVGCRTLMSALGQTRGPLALAERNMQTVARLVEEVDVKLAVEFYFGHPVLASLESVRDLLRSAGSDRCGLVLDSYHLHRSGRPGRGFAEIAPHEILHVQVSDVPAQPQNDGGVPVDRLQPGTGEVDWTGFFELLLEQGYAGVLSYEAPNPLHWSADPETIARNGREAIRDLLGRARAVSGRSPSSG